MHVLALAFFFAAAPNTVKGADPYAALRLYDGAWQVTRKDAAKADVLVNHCALLGQYFACAQSLNGTSGGLIVFMPVKDQPNRFYTQTIMPEGRATGRDDLQIEGDQWTYTSRRNDNGITTYYRTQNRFLDRNHIHFEQAESKNNRDWTVQNSGNEVRASGAARVR